eukprot:TRINITY_DN7074_c0_g4_i2.p1 TRINITY_DN7074_c0_g4~~TRINITY_DN7074_c0_g4_i2.p1  ORF type:complete len:2215 (+),score=650.22 TRINITY_DN7074_c0_g4_i2:770-7414(+)
MDHVDGPGIQTVHCSTDNNLVARLQVHIFAREHLKKTVIRGNDVIRLQQKQDSAFLTVMLKPHHSRNAQILSERFSHPEEFAVCAKILTNPQDVANNCLNMWKVENFDQFNGEQLSFSPSQRFRLRNVGTGFYLSFGRAGSEMQNQGMAKRMDLQLTARMDQATLFLFKSSESKKADDPVLEREVMSLGAAFEDPEGKPHVYWTHVGKVDIADNSRVVTGSLTIREEDAIVALPPTQQELENLYVMLAGKKTLTMFLQQVEAAEHKRAGEVDADVEDAQVMQLLQCMDHLKFICDPKGAHIYNEETQNLFRDLGIIGHLLELLQHLCVKKHFDDPVKYGREVSVCKTAVSLLTEACRDNAGNGSVLYWASQQLVQYEMETSLHTAKTLAHVYQNNNQVIRKLTPQFLEQTLMSLFDQTGKLGRQPRYLELLSCLCICNGQPQLKNQFMIANLVLVRKPHLLLQLSQESLTKDFVKGGKHESKEYNELRLQIIDSELAGGIHIVFEPSDGPMTLTRQYYCAQVELLASLCEGRNEQCTLLVQRHQSIYSFQMVLSMMCTKSFPSDIRSSFARLMLVLHLDSFSFPEEWKFPLLVRARSGPACDYFRRQLEREDVFPENELLNNALFEFFSEESLAEALIQDCNMVTLTGYFTQIASKLLRLGFMNEHSVHKLAQLVLLLLHKTGQAAPRGDASKPNPYERLARGFETRYNMIPFNAVKLLTAAQKRFDNCYRANSAAQIKLFELKASLCELLLVIFDIRLDMHLSVAVEGKAKGLRHAVLADEHKYSGTDPDSADSPDLLNVAFDLALHEHPRLSQTAMMLAARQCFQIQEVHSTLEKVVLLDEGCAEGVQEISQVVNEARRVLRLLHVEPMNAHFVDQLFTYAKTMQTEMSGAADASGERSTVLRMVFAELDVISVAFEVLDLYGSKVVDSTWMQHSGSQEIKRMVMGWLKLISQACQGMPDTKARCMLRVDELMALMGHGMGVIEVFLCMLKDSDLRTHLTESHIEMVCGAILKAHKESGRLDKKYLRMIRHMIGAKNSFTGKFEDAIPKLQVALMNQLMTPRIHELTLKPVFDIATVDLVVQNKEFSGEKYAFMLEMFSLLTLAAQDNETVRAQCRGLMRGDRICDLLIDRSKYQDKLPSKLQAALMHFLSAAFVQAAELGEQIQHRIWDMILNRLPWALQERIPSNDQEQSLMVIALLPLMDALYCATKDSTNFGFVIDDQSTMAEVKNLLVQIQTMSAGASPANKPLWSRVILGVHAMFPQALFSEEAITTLTNNAEAQPVVPTLQLKETVLQKSTHAKESILSKLEDDIKLERLEANYKELLLDRLVQDFLDVPHFCVLSLCLHHIANGDVSDDTLKGPLAILETCQAMLSEDSLLKAADYLKKQANVDVTMLHAFQRLICLMDPTMVFSGNRSSSGVFVRACDQGFNPSVADTSSETMSLLRVMLDNGDELVQKSLHAHLTSSNSPWLLYHFQEMLRSAKTVLEQGQIEGNEEHLERAIETLGLMALLCENHYNDFQLYMSDPGQADCVRGVSLLKEAVKVLSAMEPLVEAGRLADPLITRLAVQLFNTFTETLQGPCAENQHMLIHTKLCIVACTILDHVEWSEETKDLMASIIGTLQAMLEGPRESRAGLVPNLIKMVDWNSISKTMDDLFERVWNGESNESIRHLQFDAYILVRTIALESQDWMALLAGWGTERLASYDGQNRHTVLESQVGSVEIARNGKVETILFPLPRECLFIANSLAGRHERDRVLSQLEAGVSSKERLFKFMHHSHHLENVILHRYKIARLFPGSNMLNYGYFVLHPLTTCCGVVINVFMVGFYSATRDATGAINSTDTQIDDWARGQIDIFGVLLVVGALLTFSSYWLTNAIPVMQSRWEAENQSEFVAGSFSIFGKIGLVVHFFSDLKWLYHLGMFIIAILGVSVSNFFFAIFVFDVVAHSYTMQSILKTLSNRIHSISLTVILIMGVVYLYSVIGFIWFRDDFYFEDRYTCETLLQCFSTTLNYGVRSPGGVGDVLVDEPWDTDKYWSRFVFDFTFFLIVVLLLLNVVLGVIIDTFAELRQKRGKREEERRSKCLICGIKRTRFEDSSANGFARHVSDDHNMWNYVYFMVHTRRKAIDYMSEFTGPESFVYHCIQKADVSFFPVKQAAVLQSENAEAETELRTRMETMEETMETFSEFHSEAMATLHAKVSSMIGELHKVHQNNLHK